MNKRQLFRSFAGLLGFCVVPQTIRSAVAAPRHRIELQRSPLAGFQYHQGEQVWSQLQIGTELQLIREPDNIHDARAVRVDWQGQKLGYVPRNDNAALSQLLNRGQTLTAAISTLKSAHNPWDRIEFVVWLEN
ncbi:HIRAN domain-containing protein [Betaproteobacteria bacterium]|nr:HIRAN domain-containing protein [Betaproteobacteria bacterium]GHT99284.1 HIRAN domain-containing protein [Betaproteobacteria bacterium]GHU07274.1 HIRAN domain-containing protein [Betaproteobacteria bacterium]GHU23969.1 HIRAN domain-containing protein [Betaproteobacteria bacterium]